MAGTWTAVRLGRDMRPSSGTVIASGATTADVVDHWAPG